MRYLLIDDVRDFNCERTCRTVKEGIEALQEESWDVLFLDHDMGLTESGMDVLIWLEANLRYLPKEIRVITMNPVARPIMEERVRQLYNRRDNEL